MKRKVLFPLLLILGVLAFTNPDTEEFQSFIQKRMNEKMSDNAENKDDDNGELFKSLLSRPISWVIKEATVRKNYVLFSTYTVGNPETEDYALYLGIFDRFIPLKRNENLSLDLNL